MQNNIINSFSWGIKFYYKLTLIKAIYLIVIIFKFGLINSNNNSNYHYKQIIQEMQLENKNKD